MMRSYFVRVITMGNPLLTIVFNQFNGTNTFEKNIFKLYVMS